MVYRPDKPIKKRIGLFLFNAGQRYRTGPHDVYVKIGIELSKKGIFVITPDAGNLGDNFDGFWYSTKFKHHYKIQKELYVKEAIEGIKFFRKELSLSIVIVSGLCIGISALLIFWRKLSSKESRKSDVI